MATAFSDVQYADAYPDGIDRHYWNVCRTDFIKRQVKRHWPAERVLEIGCGRGFVVDALRRSGVDAWGCDLASAPPASEDVRPYVSLGVGFSELSLSLRESIRHLLLLDVLEHLHDPGVFLREMRGAFPNAREILVTVPARQEIWSDYDTYYGHVQRYSRGSLEAALDAQAIRTSDSGYFFHSLYLPARALVWAKRNRGTVVRTPSAGPASWLHWLIGRAFLIEAQVLPRRMWGTSLFARGLLPPLR